MIKLTNLLIGIVFICAFAGIFGLYLSNVAVNYGSNANDIDVEKYNKLSEIYEMADEVKTAESDIETGTGLFDLLGDMFNKGYQALRITGKSMETMSDLSTEGIDDLNVEGARLWKDAVTTSIIILLVIGVIIAVVVKVEL